jgi:hypothetical protein
LPASGKCADFAPNEFDSGKIEQIFRIEFFTASQTKD